MFVGHNLDASDSYERRLASGRSHGDMPKPMATWRKLYSILEHAELDPTQCFFTNCYVGLKKGAQARGRFPGARDKKFAAWCEGFLQFQVEAMNPRLIVTLGRPAEHFVSGMGIVDRKIVSLVHPSAARSRDDLRRDGHRLRDELD